MDLPVKAVSLFMVMRRVPWRW
ncbi:protein of unknown function (plasmid) [Azospirillum baldaniorum]|uniref:Uncharacterized protein n=1 Tax=Azospirillum baldaniorum TaxID=1064539 RepID=A0A9P1JWP9_9PROT|nr:protein of unknown function [Azospirillum baldaniorum]